MEGCIKQWFSFVKPNFEKVCLSLRPSMNAVTLRAYTLWP